MRKFNIFTVFLIAVMLAVSFFSSAAALAAPVIEADAALLVEAKSGKILYEKNKDTRIAPGSIAKVMTLLLAVEAVENGQAGLKDSITASKTFSDGIGENDKTLNIKPGEEIGFEDLMYGLYLVSANDACNILAEKIDGSISGFVDKMNEKAEALGCGDTYFVNAGGLTDARQYTSSWDQYLIFKEAVEHPLFLEIAGTVSYTVKATNKSPERSLINTNAMLDGGSAYYYKFAAAGKTASSSEYGYSFVSYAKDNRLSLISVVFGTRPGEEANGMKITGSFSATWQLYEWGFNSFVWQNIISTSDVAATEKIDLAEGVDTIRLRPSETVTILARRDLKPEDIRKDIVIYGQGGGKGLSAPVKQGDILGEMTVYVDGEVCGKVQLTAADNVELDRTGFIRNQIKNTLSELWVQAVIFGFLVLIGLYVWLVLRDRKRRREKKRQIEAAKKKIVEERQRQLLHK